MQVRSVVLCGVALWMALACWCLRRIVRSVYDTLDYNTNKQLKQMPPSSASVRIIMHTGVEIPC